MSQLNTSLLSCAGGYVLGAAFILLTILFHIIGAFHYKRIQQNREKERVAKEKYKELVMRSRISPHFLYNCLTSISALMDMDVPKAQKALKNFSLFLRENIDMMEMEELIPFSREMDHIDHYVTLEEIRHEGKLNVIFDIKVYDFMVPALSIQPLIENAIKHGVSDKDGIGTVILATWKDKDNVYINITDDGIGIDVDSINDIPKKNNDKINVGIHSSAQRLRSLCNAKIDFESRKESGTKIIIQIPMESEQ